jgi:hypothetical protein
MLGSVAAGAGTECAETCSSVNLDRFIGPLLLRPFGRFLEDFDCNFSPALN